VTDAKKALSRTCRKLPLVGKCTQEHDSSQGSLWHLFIVILWRQKAEKWFKWCDITTE